MSKRAAPAPPALDADPDADHGREQGAEPDEQHGRPDARPDRGRDVAGRCVSETPRLPVKRLRQRRSRTGVAIGWSSPSSACRAATSCSVSRWLRGQQPDRIARQHAEQDEVERQDESEREQGLQDLASHVPPRAHPARLLVALVVAAAQASSSSRRRPRRDITTISATTCDTGHRARSTPGCRSSRPTSRPPSHRPHAARPASRSCSPAAGSRRRPGRHPPGEAVAAVGLQPPG